MPSIKKNRLCKFAGCGIETESWYCEKHYKKMKPILDRKNKSKYGYMYGAQWRKARTLFLREKQYCVECALYGIKTIATVVDHIVPHKGDYNLFWDSNNWQALCKECHDRKTAKHDGGFGK